MTAPVLRLTGITKRFGALMANDAISLELHSGEILALLGENGAGKSTLVSILFGHTRQTLGRLKFSVSACLPVTPKPLWLPELAWCTSISPWPTT